MQQIKITKGHNNLLGTGYLVEIPSFRNIQIQDVKNLVFQNFWIEIPSISIEIHWSTRYFNWNTRFFIWNTRYFENMWQSYSIHLRCLKEFLTSLWMAPYQKKREEGQDSNNNNKKQYREIPNHVQNRKRRFTTTTYNLRNLLTRKLQELRRFFAVLVQSWTSVWLLSSNMDVSFQIDVYSFRKTNAIYECALRLILSDWDLHKFI